MNCWKSTANAKATLVPGEFLIVTQDGVRLDCQTGDRKTRYLNGDLVLTSHRLVWSNPSILGANDLELSLGFIALVEEDEGGFMSSEKIILHLVDPSEQGQNTVRLAFKQGGRKPFAAKLFEALKQRRWEVKIVRPAARNQPRVMRSGIGGIEKSMERKMKQTDSEISKAFQDLNKLMDMAKPMVALAKTISNKMKDKQGSDDETVEFKSYLMSLGIADPVTRDTHGSGQTYFTQLAKEVFQILDKPLQECGGMMTLTDAFCRVNRARGMALLSPEDLMNACKTFDGSQTSAPIRLHTFKETGVTVLQLTSSQVGSEETLAKTEDLVSQQPADTQGITAEEFARKLGIALVIAREQLLAAESAGRICRDDTVEGLRFFPNLLLTQS